MAEGYEATVLATRTMSISSVSYITRYNSYQYVY
jgi:hypothetical protein